MDDYDNSAQDTSNYGADNYGSNSYSQDNNYESQNHHHHHGSSQDNYSYTKENDSPKAPEPKSVDFVISSSKNDDDNSDLIDIQKDCESNDSTPNSPNETGNYENAITDRFESGFINGRKDTNGNNQNVVRNDSNTNNQNNMPEKEDLGCCGCNSGPLTCLAVFCDCFGL